MTAFRPKKYSPLRDGRAFAVPGGAASIAVTSSAAMMAMSAASLRIDPSRRPAEQQNEQSVHDEKENAGADLPRRRRVGRGSTSDPDAVREHVEGDGGRRRGPGDRGPGGKAEHQRKHEDAGGEREHERPGAVPGTLPRGQRQRVHVDLRGKVD